MRTKDKQKNKLVTKTIRSKAKYTGDFEKELEKLVENLFEFVKKYLEKNYQVEYLDYTKRNIIGKISDDDKFIFRSFKCLLDGSIADKKYGNFYVELTFTQISSKPVYKLVGKYNLGELSKIKNDLLHCLIDGLEEIY